MDTVMLQAIGTAVTGARHQRVARNGQDAAVAWIAHDRDGNDAAVVVVSDGCSGGASSEVGARLGASLFACGLASRIERGDDMSSLATWSTVRADVVKVLAELLDRLGRDRAHAIHEHLLFTIVAAVATQREAVVWALGDGAYSFGDHTRTIGPFADNQPPYLAYDLLGEAQPAHFEIGPSTCGAIVVATDGAMEVDGGLERFATADYVEHPDRLRRHLALLARPVERIDWEERRVVRTPAALQDDCAIGIVRWSAR
jgi:hypothetical protein